LGHKFLPVLRKMQQGQGHPQLRIGTCVKFGNQVPARGCGCPSWGEFQAGTQTRHG
jgi:hypothetical protein